MIITCEACGTSFKLKTSLVKETGSTVRCSKCQRVFIAYPTSTGIEKPSAFKLDKSLEAKIDDVLGDEFDDELDAIEFNEDTEKVPGGTFGDEFSDLESEISLETAEISTATSDDLFDSTASLLDSLEEGEEEPEIMMSALLQEDDDILSMDDLVSAKTSESLDMNDLLVDDSDSDIVSFDELESKTTEEDDDLGALLEAEEESDIASFGDFEKTEDVITLDAMEEEPAQDEKMVVVDDLDSEDAFEQPVIDEPFAEDQVDFIDSEDSAEFDGKAEPEQIMVETEGGVIADLDEFDVTQEPEKEKASGRAAKKAEKPAQEPKKEAIIPADEEDFELDFDLEYEEPAVVSEKKGAEADDLDLDFDFGEAAASGKADVEKDEFEMDLDLELGSEDGKEDSSTLAADEEDFELDFDLDASEPAVVSEKKDAEADDLGLDMDGFEDLDLTEATSLESMDDDLGLDLDEFDDLDLGEDLGKDSVAGRQESMEDLDFDMDLDLDGESKQISAAEAEKDEFDLDFDLDAEAPVEAAAAEEDEFDLDLDIAPEAVEAKGDTGDFDLDFDDVFEDKTVTVSETLLDESTVAKSEEFDLTQIEDILDFEESPKPEKVKAEAAPKSMESEIEMEEPELYTASDEDDMNIDLETMLDEEEAADRGQKEVSLETVEQRDKQVEQQYRKTVMEEEPAPEEVSEDLSREFEDEFKAAASMRMARMPEKEKGRNLKKVLAGLLLLIIIGAIGFIGWQMFAGKEETPPPAVTAPVKDLGNLQMEMMATPAYKFVENKTSGELLIINGNVTNRYDHPRSNVQVKGTLYNNAGKVIISSVVYCGNMFTDAELTDLDIKTIEGRLNNRVGDNQMNSGINSGQSVPFTIVFKNLPQDMSEFTVEVAASVK